jgi:hypothetical protein
VLMLLLLIMMSMMMLLLFGDALNRFLQLPVAL